jgi:hypothetical protein
MSTIPSPSSLTFDNPPENVTVHLTIFDNPPEGVTVSTGVATFTGETVAITGPFDPGVTPEDLTVSTGVATLTGKIVAITGPFSTGDATITEILGHLP